MGVLRSYVFGVRVLGCRGLAFLGFRVSVLKRGLTSIVILLITISSRFSVQGLFRVEAFGFGGTMQVAVVGVLYLHGIREALRTGYDQVCYEGFCQVFEGFWGM